jgi:tetratricopeptide (TPR) repeat protein
LGEAFWQKYKGTRSLDWLEPAAQNSRRAAELNGQLAPVRITLGFIAQGSGRPADALREFQVALDIDKASSEAYRGLASAYEALGDTKEAENTFLKAIQVKPSYWASYHQLGAFYYSQRRYEDAARMFSHVVSLTPDNLKGYNDRGVMYVALERWNEALQDFNRSIEIQPNYRAYSNLGVLHHYRGNFNDSARMYEKALQLNASDYRVWGNLAAAYYWSPDGKEKAKAPSTYERAAQMAAEQLRAHPLDSAVVINLAQYYAMLQKSDTALFFLGQALALAPKDNKTMFRAAEIYEHLGNRSLALRYVKVALESGYSKKQIERSLDLRELHSDSRFQEILQSAK